MRTNPLGTPIYTHTLRSAQYPFDKTKSRVRGSYHSGLRSLATMETTHGPFRTDAPHRAEGDIGAAGRARAPEGNTHSRPMGNQPIAGFGGPNPACGSAHLHVRVHWLLSRGVTRTLIKAASESVANYTNRPRRVRLTVTLGCWWSKMRPRCVKDH